MNKWVAALHKVGSKNQRMVIGLMSGTSLDGLDIALCQIIGSGTHTGLSLVHFDTKPYTERFQHRIREVFAKRIIDQQVLCGLHAWVGEVHGALVNEALDEWGIDRSAVDLIASHGQTVYHAPQLLTGNTDYPNSTLQIGDGDHLAVTTGIITVSDFRQKHLAAGGEGAPLAAYGDYLLFSAEKETRILLNIGGIANFTYLPADETGQPCFATDVGPGNTLMNQYMQAHRGEAMDEDGRLAAAGNVSQPLLDALLGHDFFRRPFPKTTGPELFHLGYLLDAQTASQTTDLPEADVMATLCAFSASAMAIAIRQVASHTNIPHVYVSGGGLHNTTLMKRLRAELGHLPVHPFDKLGLLPDAKEAALFALLANETVAGSPKHTNVLVGAPAVCMGKISFPE